MSSAADPLAYYAAQSEITDPKDCASLFDDLPDDLNGLHRAIDNVLIHNAEADRKKISLSPERKREFEIHGAARMLKAIQDLQAGPLLIKRVPERRLVVDCRHFAVLLCAILRRRGIPARVRCGFATYLTKKHYMDHWLCEYWSVAAGRWILEDPNLSIHDVSPEKFITGAAAWRQVRKEGISAYRFGYGEDRDVRGLWAVQHDLMRDYAALNKVELLSADRWGIMIGGWPPQAATGEQADVLDRAADLALAGNDSFAAMRALYEENDILRVPETINSYNYTTGETHRVDWRAAL